MRQTLLAAGEWALDLMGVSDALIGDLRESAETRRGRRRYACEVAAIVLLHLRRFSEQHPVRAFHRTCLAATVLAAPFVIGLFEPRPNVQNALRVKLEASGWSVAALEGGGTRLVPAITVGVTNDSGTRLRTIQLCVVFERADRRRAWGRPFQRATSAPILEPGSSTSDVFVEGERGYLGPEPAAAMFVDPRFVDADASVFGRYGSQGWARLATFRVDRVLLNRARHASRGVRD